MIRMDAGRVGEAGRRASHCWWWVDQRVGQKVTEGLLNEYK